MAVRRIATNATKARPIEMPAAHAVPVASGLAGNNLGARIAAEIEQDIIASGWKIGGALGNEEYLVERFGVSRWVVREALAITERKGLTHMRRGRGGGLFVSAPAETVVETTMRNYLLCSGIDAASLIRLRRVIDGLACSLAIADRNEERLAAGQALLERLAARSDLGAMDIAIDLYRQILSLSNNRLLLIFGQVLSQLTFSLGICLGSRQFRKLAHNSMTRQMGERRRAHLECLVGLDTYGAIQAATAAYDDIFAMYADSPLGGQRFDLGASIAATQKIAEEIVSFYPAGTGSRRVDTLTLQIQLDIQRLQLMPGASIGQEKELMEHYGVGRNTLREAIRVLQQDNIVSATGGHQGGLCVGMPTFDNIIRSNLQLFQFMQLEAREVEPIATELQVLAAEFTAARVTREGRACIAALEKQLAQPLSAADLLQILGTSSGDMLLEMFARTVTALQHAEISEEISRSTAVERIELQRQLYETLCLGDIPRSRRLTAQFLLSFRNASPDRFNEREAYSHF